MSELLYRTELSQNIVFFTKLLYLSASAIPSFFILFSHTFPNNELILKRTKVLVFSELLLIASLVTFTGLIVETSIPHLDQAHKAIFGPLYIVYILHIIVPFLSGFFVLMKKRNKETGRENKKKLTDILIGTVVTFILATASNLFAPYLKMNNTDWLGPIFTILMVIFIAKGMLSEKIFGAKIFFQRKIMTRAVVLALLLTYLGAIYLGYLFLSFVSNVNIRIDGRTFAHVLTFIAAFIFIVIFLTVILISKSTKDTPRKIFIFMLFILAGWVATLVGSELITDPVQALFWARLPYVFIVWLVPAMIFLFYFTVHKKIPGRTSRLLLIFCALVVMVVSQTNLYVAGIRVLKNGLQDVVVGPLYGYDALYYVAAIAVCLFLTFNNWKKLDSRQKDILKIIGPSYLIAFIPPIITGIIFPAIGMTYFYGAFGVITGIFMLITGTSIAIYREKFLNIKLRIQRSFFLRSIAFITTLLYLAAIFAIYEVITLFRTNHDSIVSVLTQNGSSFILLFALMIFVTYLIAKKRETKTQKTFIFLVLAIIATLFGVIMSSIVPYSNVLVSERLVYLGASWIPSLLFLLFYHLITNRNITWKQAVLIFSPAVALAIIGQTPLVIRSVVEVAPFVYNDIRGPLFSIEALYYPIAFLAILYVATKSWSEMNPEKHRQLRFLLMGFFVSVLPSLVVNAILPHFFDVSRYYQLTFDVGVFLFILVTSSAVLKFKFLQVRLFFKRRFVTTAIIGSLVILYTSLLLLIGSAINNFYVYNGDRHLFVELLTKNAMHIFTFIFLVIFSTFIAAKKPENRQQKIFFSVLVMIGLWLALLTAAEFATGSNTSLLWWNRVNYVPVLWFPMAMSYLFHNIIYKRNPSRVAFWVWIIVTLAMHYVFLSNLFMASVVRVSPYEIIVTPGPLQLVEVPFFLLPFVVYTILVLKNWKNLEHRSKKQLKIILPGFTLATLPPVAVDMLVIRFGFPSYLDQYTNFMVVFGFVLTTTIAIFDHKFLDIKLKITTQLVRRFFATILVLIILPLLIWILFVKQYFPQNNTGKIITVLFIIFALFPLFNRFLENFINRIIFKNVKTPAEIINHIVEKISTTADANRITTVLLQELTTQLNLHGAAYFAKTNSHFELQKEMNYPEATSLSQFASTENIIEILEKENSYTIETLKKQPNTSQFVNKLEEANAEVAVPFTIENKLVGLLVLKEKRHNEAFAKDELHILDTLSFHFAATIHNAILFEKVKSFASDLEEKVEQATEALKAKNEELAKVQEEKSRFFADIAHEFKTPITVMKGNIDLLVPRLPENQGHALQHEVHRMNQLTSDLLELSRAETGEIMLHLERVDLRELIISVLAEITTLGAEKKITICNHVEKNIFVQGDRTRLRQIVLNLLTNAIKYNKENGRIDIEIQETENQICLSVSDSGIGIPQEQLSKVFERFFRVDKSYSKKQGGTGLGLAIVKLMTELHGGTVNVQSEEGKGTKFTVCLPKNHTQN